MNYKHKLTIQFLCHCYLAQSVVHGFLGGVLLKKDNLGKNQMILFFEEVAMAIIPEGRCLARALSNLANFEKLTPMAFFVLLGLEHFMRKPN